MTLSGIQKRLERLLPVYWQELERTHGLYRISPLLSSGLRNFVLHPGKLLRPTLMVAGFSGYARKSVPGLYRAALAFELLHDFMLVHDDIVDHSSTRRGQPSLHCFFRHSLAGKGRGKVTGEDLALVAGDVLYAAALETFLTIKAAPGRKEKALRQFIKAALLTGAGQFLEMEAGNREVEQVSREQILRIYDLKTAGYSFAAPLVTGALLAGAGPSKVKALWCCGLCLGRAFQIRDDVLGLFGQEEKTGKSTLTDLQEAKKTLLLWRAFHHGETKHRTVIKAVLAKKVIARSDLKKIQKIVMETGSLTEAEREIKILLSRARHWVTRSGMKRAYRQALLSYAGSVLLE
ncbi:MAG TPA: polyprenyl synthetase family protein [bacterium]|nr:polyprenyl synthetase family protein [bacterium]HOL66205.1 polyprenyl synthetase family protein [bacterium]HPP12673.1 polyprenyl synthetase family protein [bacterium]